MIADAGVINSRGLNAVGATTYSYPLLHIFDHGLKNVPFDPDVMDNGSTCEIQPKRSPSYVLKVVFKNSRVADYGIKKRSEEYRDRKNACLVTKKK